MPEARELAVADVMTSLFGDACAFQVALQPGKLPQRASDPNCPKAPGCRRCWNLKQEAMADFGGVARGLVWFSTSIDLSMQPLSSAQRQH